MYEQLEQKEIAYVRGRVAGDYVQDDEGNMIIAPGQMITDDIIESAVQAGQLHYLMIAAASGALQPGSEDLAKRLQEFRDVTEGHEIDFVRNREVGMDVSDFQGNIIVHAGDTVSDDIIRRAQESGFLQELVLAVGAPGLSILHEKAA